MNTLQKIKSYIKQIKQNAQRLSTGNVSHGKNSIMCDCEEVIKTINRSLGQRKLPESHRIWNKHNPKSTIKGGNYKYVVHHIDGNHENNDISNLQKMTHSEHTILHKTNSKHSKQTKEKMSKSRMGNTNRLGTIHSEATKKKMSLARKGKKFPKRKRNAN
jgi:hypothetical protein